MAAFRICACSRRWNRNFAGTQVEQLQFISWRTGFCSCCRELFSPAIHERMVARNDHEGAAVRMLAGVLLARVGFRLTSFSI